VSIPIQESFLSGRVGFLNYRGLLRANLTQERFQVAFLWGTIIATVPIDQIKEVREIRNEMEKAKAAGERVWEMPTADPAQLADLLWTMHGTKGQPEATYPEGLFDR
jgi:hypothetical protein